MTSKKPFCTGIVGKAILNLENEKYVVSYLGRAQLHSHSCYFGVSVHRGQTPAAQPGARLSPASASDCQCLATTLPSLRMCWDCDQAEAHLSESNSGNYQGRVWYTEKSMEKSRPQCELPRNSASC